MTTTETQTAEAAQEQMLSPEPIMNMMQGAQVTAILQAGVELGVFDRIAEGKNDASSIATAIGASERGTRILVDALAALGLVEQDGSGYRLSPPAATFLVSTEPAYLGAMVRIMAGEWSWIAYPRLAEAVRSGGTVLEENVETPEFSFWETFAASSTGVAGPAAHAVAEILAPWARERDPLEVLDIACGSGLFGLTLAGQQEHARLTLLDWPNVLAITRGTVEQRGLLERTDFIEGDVFEVPLGGPYDVILASHILHHFSEDRCLQLLRRLAEALKPDGKLAINEFTAAGERIADEPFPRLFSVIMLSFSHEGEAYPVSTYRRLLEKAGFAAPEVHQGRGMPSRFLIAEKAR